jgi:hypothetical protein
MEGRTWEEYEKKEFWEDRDGEVCFGRNIKIDILEEEKNE